MPYAYLTLAQIRTQLANRLYDTSANLFWSDDEKSQYIIEALRTWNALTFIWRSEFVFPTVQNTTWYDLTDSASIPTTVRPFTVTDNAVIQMIEFHLLEPLTAAYPLVWSGSAQFTINDILSALQRRRDEVLSVTGCTISRSTPVANIGRTFLPDNVIDIRRVAWLPVVNPSGYINSRLWPDGDEWALQAYQNDFLVAAPGTPSTYRQSTEPPLSFDVDIVPAVPGMYEVLSVNAGAALSTTASALLGVPDDFVWVIKWGALADLLGRESNSKDMLRSQYCQSRYAHGLALLMASPAVLAARLNGSPLDIDSVQNTDDYRPGWQSETAGQPNLLMITGLNLVGLATTPDAGPYSVRLSVVQNAPVPVLDSDLIQLGRDAVDSILDYAQHLASFKMGGQEFLSTIPLLQKFLKHAAIYNSKLDALGEYVKPIFELSQLQAEANSVYSDVNITLDEGSK